jgi:hypothetical protein
MLYDCGIKEFIASGILAENDVSVADPKLERSRASNCG